MKRPASLVQTTASNEGQGVLGTVLPPKGHLMMSGTFLVVTEMGSPNQHLVSRSLGCC